MFPTPATSSLLLAFFFATLFEGASLTTAPFNLTVELTAESKISIATWIALGSLTKLNIRPTFSKELQLPNEAYLCPELPDITNVDHAQLIFNWCLWEWEVEGRYGVWDGDFRFDVYSMGITTLAAETITVEVDFEISTNNETKDYFNTCLSLPEKIQEIARAIKFEIDEHHSAFRDPENVVFKLKEMEEEIVLDRGQEKDECASPKKRIFGASLSNRTILCFKAIRPSDPFLLTNYTTNTSELIRNETYHLSQMCLRGKNKLQNWKLILALDQSLPRDLSTELEVFEWIIMILIILFLPLIVLKIMPWSEDIAKPLSGGVVDAVREEGKRVIFEEQRLLDEKMERDNDDSTKLSPINNNVQLEVRVDDVVKGVITVEKKDQKDLSWESLSWANLFLCSFEGDNVDIVSASGGFDVNNKDEVKQFSWIEKRFQYVPLDTSTPFIFGFKLVFAGKIPKWFGRIVGAFLTTFRRFVFVLVGSCHAVVLMGILDHLFYYDTIQKLMQFRKEHLVEVRDLKYWNFLFMNNWNISLKSQSSFNNGIRFDILYIFLACYYAFSILLYSVPGITHMCVKAIYPTEYFGPFKCIQFPNRHTYGLNKVYEGLTYRMGIFVKKTFWTKWKRQVFVRDETTKKLSAKLLFQGICSLFCLFSALPIVAVFPPLYCWTKRPKKTVLFHFLAGISVGILGFLIVVSLDIYLRFILFTVTALIFHYQVTIGIASIVAGCVGFAASIISQVKDGYIADKTIIQEAAGKIHGDKILKFAESRNRIIKFNKKNPRDRIHVPELVWWWEQENWPCIPRELYCKVVDELRPLGTQREIFALKVLIMGFFLVFIYTVMKTLGMNNANSAFDVVKALLTVIAVVFPALLAKLSSSKAIARMRVHKKGIVRQEVERFLLKNENEMYYNYDAVINELKEKIEKSESEETKTGDAVESTLTKNDRIRGRRNDLWYTKYGSI